MIRLAWIDFPLEPTKIVVNIFQQCLNIQWKIDSNVSFYF